MWSFSGLQREEDRPQCPESPWHVTTVYSEVFSLVSLPGGQSLWPCAASFQKCLEGRGLVFRICCLQPALSVLVELCCGACTAHLHAGWSGRLAGLLGACPVPFFLTLALVLQFPFPSTPFVDCPASCVCLYCPGVQLDRATLWQVPQPGASALDVPGTVHICQVCACLLLPGTEGSPGRTGCLLCWGPRGGGLKNYTVEWILSAVPKPLHNLILDEKNSSEFCCHIWTFLLFILLLLVTVICILRK